MSTTIRRLAAGTALAVVVAACGGGTTGDGATTEATNATTTTTAATRQQLTAMSTARIFIGIQLSLRGAARRPAPASAILVGLPRKA